MLMQGGEVKVQVVLQIFLPIYLSSYKQLLQNMVPGFPIDSAEHTFCTDNPLQLLVKIWARDLEK